MQQQNTFPGNTGDGVDRNSRDNASVGGNDVAGAHYPVPVSKPSPMLDMSSPAPLLRPPIPGSRDGGARTPRLGLAIPPSPNAKPVNGGPTPQGLLLQMPGQANSARSTPGLSLQMPGQAPARPSPGGLSLQMPGQPTSSRPAPSRPARGGLSLQMPGAAPSPRPSLPRLQLATPMGSNAPAYEQQPGQSGRPSISIATGQSASGGSESSAAHSRSGSFGPLDGRASGPTSAGSQYSALSFASQYGLQQPQRSTPDPASAAGSLYSNYSEGGAGMERDGSMNGLEGFENLSLESVEKGRTLDVDELDDDGWRVASMEKRIQELGSLGEGAGGAVTRCVLKGGKTVFALKIITTNPDPDVKKQIVREIGFNKECAHEHICKYYGAFVDQSTSTISIAMEFCEGGSLDSIYREVQRRDGRCGESFLGKVAVGVLTGLEYLLTRRIMHRDIKPSNILLCRDGQVKLCDFGVSGEFGTKGDANTFIGTSYYMAPERITGQRYTITSDVWSMGVTLLEVAQNRFPFPADGTESQPRAGLIDLLTYIVRQPVPVLKDEPLLGIEWSAGFKEFIAACLVKDPEKRPTPSKMFAKNQWINQMAHTKVNIAKFLRKVWVWEEE